MKEVKLTGTKEWAAKTVNIQYGCENNCRYCVSPETRIIMEDHTEKTMNDLQIGDIILGFDNKHNLKPSVVINKWETEQLAYEVLLEDQTKLICSANHRWLSNRGWKYTIGEMNGDNRRPYLTLQNTLSGLYYCSGIDYNQSETEMYMKGYLAGLIEGDGILKLYEYPFEKHQRIDRQWQFSIRLKDTEALTRSFKYLQYFGIETNWFQCFNNTMQGIRCSSQANFDRIKQLVLKQNHKEFYLGYLGGFYDAEGSQCGGEILRMGDTSLEHFEFIKKCLKEYSFEFKEEMHNTKNKVMYSVRLLGGISERIRFYSLTNPAILRKRKIRQKKAKYPRQIKSIICLNQIIRMIDIQTSTENFFANGICSHNCYAKRMAGRFDRIPEKGWDHPIIKTNYLEGLPRNSNVMFPSTHDLTMNNIEDYWTTIIGLLKRKNQILIVSKPRIQPMRLLIDNLVNIDNEYRTRDNIEFRFTIGSCHNDRLKYWEPNASSFEERIRCVDEALCARFPVSISCEPLLDGLEYPTIQNARLENRTIPLIDQFLVLNIKELWIGAMNYNKDAPNLDYEGIYARYKDNPKIKWKESFRKHLKKESLL